jgi:predicted double-glycine peptidase
MIAERLAKLRPLSSRRRVPVIRQLNAVECGAASLAMILSYHGRPLPTRA